MQTWLTCGELMVDNSMSSAALRSASGSPTFKPMRPITVCWTIGRDSLNRTAIVRALKAKQEDMGVDIRENKPVIGFELRDGPRARSSDEFRHRRSRTRQSVPSTHGRTMCLCYRSSEFASRTRTSCTRGSLPSHFQSPPRLPAVNDHVLDCLRATDGRRPAACSARPIDVGSHEMRGPEFDVGELEPHPGALAVYQGENGKMDGRHCWRVPNGTTTRSG